MEELRQPNDEFRRLEQPPRLGQELRRVVRLQPQPQREFQLLLQVLHKLVRPRPLQRQEPVHRLLFVALGPPKPFAPLDAPLPRPNAVRWPLREVRPPHVADVAQLLLLAPELDQVHRTVVQLQPKPPLLLS